MNLAGFYDNYQYAETPLAFVELFGLRPIQKVELLKELDQLYGDTDQDTPEWALEYQVAARMLLHDDWMVVNPQMLEIAEAKDGLLHIMGPDNARIWEAALEMSPADIYDQYTAQA